jgi:hypothetical protein
VSDERCWNCDAAPNPAEELFEVNGVALTTWSCPKCSERWTNGIDEQDREIAAAKREAATLRARVEELTRERDGFEDVLRVSQQLVATLRDGKEALAALSSERRRRERVEGRLARVLRLPALREIQRCVLTGIWTSYRGRVWSGSRSRSRGGEGER